MEKIENLKNENFGRNFRTKWTFDKSKYWSKNPKFWKKNKLLINQKFGHKIENNEIFVKNKNRIFGQKNQHVAKIDKSKILFKNLIYDSNLKIRTFGQI